MSGKKKKGSWFGFLRIVFLGLTGVLCGLLMGCYVNPGEGPFVDGLPAMIAFFIEMYAALFIQLIVHEAGHLVFGLLSGYRFVSFRIFSFMWVKEKGKIRLKRLSIAGTGGQCLMAPPELKDGKIPTVLYNLGGSLMNLLTCIVFLGLFFAFSGIPFLPVAMLCLAAMGFLFALMNGVPMRTEMVDNDGYNAISLRQNPQAMRALWIQLKVNEWVAEGLTYKDMPEEWFTVPSDEEMENSMVAVIGVLACSRLMDEHKFEEADRLMEHLLTIDSAMVGLHRSLMICDRIYVELLSQNRREALDELLSAEQRKFMKQMKHFLTVLRTEYAYALLCEKDRIKAEKIKARFEKRAKSYPYRCDVEAEQELMKIAQNKAQTLLCE